MIEDALLNYGVLGLWTATLLLDKIRAQKRSETVIKQNTDALIRIGETIKKCPKAKVL